MPEWAVHSLFLLAASFVTLNGVLMLFAPAMHRRFLDLISRADSWSRPARAEPQGGLEIERRLAGLGLTAMGLLFAGHAIEALLRIKTKPGTSPPVENVGGDWFSIILAVGLFAFGAFVTVRPEWLVRWSIKHQPTSREITDSTVALWSIGARLLGAAFVLGGLYVLWVALKHAWA